MKYTFHKLVAVHKSISIAKFTAIHNHQLGPIAWFTNHDAAVGIAKLLCITDPVAKPDDHPNWYTLTKLVESHQMRFEIALPVISVISYYEEPVGYVDTESPAGWYLHGVLNQFETRPFEYPDT